MAQPSLTDLRAFMAVAEQRSFRRAADFLGVTRSSLSHSVRGLEDSLGTRLLNRTTRSVSPTEAGERLLSRLPSVLSDLDTALEEVAVAHGRAIGRLRINGPENAIRYLLHSVVPEFLVRYPAVELDLVAEGRLIEIVEQGFDAGVRLGESLPKDMVAVRLGPDIRFLAVASPDYLAAYPAPKVPDGLHQHQCIRLRLPSGKRYRRTRRARNAHARQQPVDGRGSDARTRHRLRSRTLRALRSGRWTVAYGAGGLVPGHRRAVALLPRQPPCADQSAGLHRTDPRTGALAEQPVQLVCDG
jgi:DNA-binding transcriptional LysR family regulator